MLVWTGTGLVCFFVLRFFLLGNLLTNRTVFLTTKKVDNWPFNEKKKLDFHFFSEINCAMNSPEYVTSIVSSVDRLCLQDSTNSIDQVKWAFRAGSERQNHSLQYCRYMSWKVQNLVEVSIF